MPYLTYRLTQINHTAIKAADAYYKSSVGLKVRELRVLRLIHDYPQCTASQLLQELEFDKAALSKHISLLEQQGLICRAHAQEDGRRQHLSLSEKGLQIWQTAQQLGFQLEQEMFSGLTKEEWLQLHQLLEKAWDSLQNWRQKMEIHDELHL